jgi:hypothetical protein
LDILNLTPRTPLNTIASPLAGGAAPVPNAVASGAASPRVTNFAQNLATDGASIKGIGATAMGGLFQPQAGAGMTGGVPVGMGGPTLTQSGFDMDRAFKLTSEKISAGKTDGSDLFASQLAATGE